MAHAIRDHLNPPYIVFGHSMGALLAFELARAIRANDDPPPATLIVSGHRAPQLPDPEKPIHDLDEDEFLAHLDRLAGTPREVLQNEELCALLLPILRADFELCENYTYVSQSPLECPIVVYRGREDSRTPTKLVEPWSEQTIAGCAFRSFAGDHFFLQSARAELLADLRARCLSFTGAEARWA
jgi:medium-chain acyl-[acyl-carrier-protein] hydrolase